MSNLVINANSIYDRVIRIGRQTENLVSEITFNLGMWIEEYGAGECVLNVRRNGDANAYPVPMTITDGKATWTITDTDTAKKGRGEIQLFYTVGEKVKTSPIFTISCGESLVGDGEPPSGYEDWLTEMNRMTAQVEAAKTSASASAQTAQTAAGTAAEKASEAEQSATTASGFANNASASAQSASESAQAAAQSAQAASVARTAAEAAAISAQAEAEDAEAAKTAAQTAETGATASAQTASTKASEATASAQSAASSAQTATDKATLASQKAAVASESASLSTAKASEAATSETNAVTAANTATAKASEAAASATSAQEYDESAQQSAVNAQTSATNAAASEAAAKRYAEDSAAYLRAYPTDTAEGEIASFSDGADDVPLKFLVVDIEPVQDLHGYDSPWPAGGSVQLLNIPDMPETTRNGVTYHIENGVIYANGTCTGGFAPFANMSVDFASGTYTFSVNLLSGSTSSVNNSFNGYDSSNARSWLVAFGIGTYPGKMTKTADIKKIDILFNNGTVFNNAVLAFQVEAGSEVSTFRPYSNICPISGWTGMTVNANGTEIPISWESEAGTVYGGTLDVTNGVLTVTKGFIQSYNGEALPSTWISDRDVYAQGATPTTGAEVCYTLAEPITYQLTPTEVKSLLGTNKIYADTGDATVEYRADTSAYVAKKIAEAISALS